MDWSNEEYVRLYVRETAADLELSWEALALWRALLIRFDRSGLIPVRNGWASVARLVRMPTEVVQQTGPELVRDGRVRMIEGFIHAPNFTAAQTASKSDKARQRESRERRRHAALSATDVVDSTMSGHSVSHAVTTSHERSRNVTLALASADPEPLLIPPDAPAVECPTPRAAKRALPEDWQPDRSAANIAAEQEAERRGVNVAAQLESMRDWARANAAKKIDWNATWRNWTRNAKAANGVQSNFALAGGLRRSEKL